MEVYVLGHSSKAGKCVVGVYESYKDAQYMKLKITIAANQELGASPDGWWIEKMEVIKKGEIYKNSQPSE
jgi:hypothetical protein